MRPTLRNRTLTGALALAAALAALILGMPGLLGQPATCPNCGQPLEPGAEFCGHCGRKVESAAPAVAVAADPRSSVVQVVTAHDNELTSTLAAIEYHSNVHVDSLLGSAFAIAPGEFITDSALLIGAKEVRLRLPSGQSVAARIAGSDAMIGVALLEADLPDIPPLALRDTEAAHGGETLRALGYLSGGASGGAPAVSTGVVSGVGRTAGLHPVEDYVQTDASLPHGFLGGPMIDARGQVVGMSTGLVFGARVSLGPQSGIGYAVPAAWIAKALAWIRAGMPARAWIGAFPVRTDPDSRARFKLPATVPYFVDQVFPGSPAAAAGLRRGDGLVAIGGVRVTTQAQVQDRLLAARPGEALAVEVMREGATEQVQVTLAARPEKPRLAGVDALRFFGDVEIAARDSDTLVVSAVTPGSDPSQEKIVPGDVLLSVLSKKDWEHGTKDNARWRSVHTLADLEERLATAYSDLDFALGARFRSKDGIKREIYVWEILTPTAAF
jgi:S1-C subfamily serine protease